MSKRLPKRKFIGIMKNPQQPQMYSKELVAIHAKKAMDYLTPLIWKDNMPPTEAIVLSAMMMDYNIRGKERPIPEDEVKQLCSLVLAAWKQGLFKPCSAYPHTLKETLEAFSEE